MKRVWLVAIVFMLLIATSYGGPVCEGIENSVGFLDADTLIAAGKASMANQMDGGFFILNLVATGQAIELHRVPLKVITKEDGIVYGSLRDGTKVFTFADMLNCYYNVR
jgi:hypothetical protein